MRTDPWMLETVVFVGATSTTGVFIPHGTGFLTMRTYKGYRANLIITAKHVLDGCPGEQISYRLNTKNGPAEVITIPKADFCIYHHDEHSDVAAIFAPHNDNLYEGKYWTIDQESAANGLPNTAIFS